MKALRIAAVTVALLVSLIIWSYFSARHSSNSFLGSDGAEREQFVFNGGSLSLTKGTLCWRMAYYERETFSGFPIVVYVSLFGCVLESEPTF